MASFKANDNSGLCLEVSERQEDNRIDLGKKSEDNFTYINTGNTNDEEISCLNLKEQANKNQSNSKRSTEDDLNTDLNNLARSTQSPSSASDSNNQWDSPYRESASNHEMSNQEYEGNNVVSEPISVDTGNECKRKRCDSSSSLSSLDCELTKCSGAKKLNLESNISFESRKRKTQKQLRIKNVDADKEISTLLETNGCPFAKNNDNTISYSEPFLKDSVEDEVENNSSDLNRETQFDEPSPNHNFEFDVLDDLEESDGEDIVTPDSNLSEPGTDGEDELPVEDIDAMLEEGLPEKFKDSSKGDGVVKVKRKVVLEEIGQNHFELLPEDWIQIMHNSGMPLYLHKKSRVCTLSRPYFLGPGSSRNHKVPLSAIPCLQYKKALDAALKKKEEDEIHLENNPNQSDIQLMGAKIETAEENYLSQSLEASELREYCEKVFKFKTISIMPFKSWADRRKYVRTMKDVKRKQRPTLPNDTKLLKIPVHGPGEVSKEWIINPNGKSYVCILHEYVQHALKTHPKYVFKELTNPATPYSATVLINEMQYGVGLGASKKLAKNAAAKAALDVLIPDLRDTVGKDASKTSESPDSLFDQVKIEDPRVPFICTKTSEPPPYAILLTCLSRNMGLGSVKVEYKMSTKKNKEDEFVMKVGNHHVTVLCKNKRDGKQSAAQAILQALHPNLKHWGSLLRMYGNKSVKSVKEKKQEEQQITSLQSKAAPNQPNNAILKKLQEEMLKLKEKRDSFKGKGKFIPPDNILASLSSTDLCKVNLI